MKCKMTVDIETLPFTFMSLKKHYAEGLKPEAVIAEAYRRLAAVNDPGIFIHLAPQADVMAAARALGDFDPAKPLWGIPFAVKDNIDVAGMPTTCACPDFEFMPQGDAFVVAKLKAAGAIPIGKTNLDQFATGLVGIRTPYPAPRNAVDPEIVPGGSSGGSGVIVAHGIVSFSLGTDTAGSGRVPAALNNIVGLKPSLGALSASGMAPACRTLDTISIFALTVDDAFAAYACAFGYDKTDAYSRPIAAPHLQVPQVGLKIGVPDAATVQFFGDGVQKKSFADACAALEKMGHDIVKLDFSPLYEIAAMLYEGAWVAERYAAIEMMMKEKPGSVHPVTRGIIGQAEKLTAADAFKGFYRLADLKRLAEPLLEQVDCLCVPTIPRFFSLADLEADPVGPNSKFGTYTNFVNLLDMAGIAVPVHTRTDGRPGSVTLLGKSGTDGLLAGMAKILHENAGVTLGATGWPLVRTRAPAPTAGPGEIAVALVGAHMSGLPLNHEIAGRGGRFLYASQTAPVYRFYALAGGPPKRPGLVRSDEGGSIALEVWAMPLARFGEFMSGIPSPLGIGSVLLQSGEQVKGFLCESAGTNGAEDITSFGGWRSYMASLR
jgi:allophanate hydrolase